MDHRARIPIIPFGLNITVSPPLFVTSSIAKFHVNFSFSIMAFCAFLSNTLTLITARGTHS